MATERVIIHMVGQQVIDRLPQNRDDRRVQSAYHDECLPLVIVM